MLIRFSAQNHLSLKGPQALSLVASSLKDSEAGLIQCAALPDARLLPAAVIYGSNASGKSNFVAAIEFVARAILLSHRMGEPGGEVPRAAFALDHACSAEPSVFNIDFIIHGARYQYGFEALDNRFSAEWLYAFPSQRRQVLYERDERDFRFGRSLKGRNKVIADLTRPNSLFISAALQNDHEQLSDIASFFKSLGTDTEIAVESTMASRVLADGEVDSRVIAYLEMLGTGVVGYQKIEQEIPEEVQLVMREFRATIQKLSKGRVTLESDALDIRRPMIELAHRGVDGEAIYLDLERESAGTRRLLLLLGRVFQALDTGSLLVVDELDASLHTKACELVLALFSNDETNPKGAQLIATTHDTNLLSSPVLRRDQVWFTEKDSEGATHVYPLTDIRTRKGDNVERGYLQGRYGAIAYSGPLSDLVSTD